MLFEQLWDMQGKTAIFGRGGFNIRTFSHNGTIDKSRQKNGIPTGRATRPLQNFSGKMPFLQRADIESNPTGTQFAP